MKQKMLFLGCLLICMTFYSLPSFAIKEKLAFTVGIVDPTQPNDHNNPRMPIAVPDVAIEEFVLYFSESHPSYIIKIEAETGDIVFEQNVPTNMLFLDLPFNLKGDYSLILVQGKRFFSSKITL